MMTDLPRIMIAPNGARRTKKHHIALPMTQDEIVETAVQCHAAGVGGIHFHVRDPGGRHVLDAGKYRETLRALETACPNLWLQVSSESIGVYNAAEQRHFLKELRPMAASMALREIMSDGVPDHTRAFYEWVDDIGIMIQTIVYDPDEIVYFAELMAQGVVKRRRHQVLFVLGRYDPEIAGRPEQLDAFLNMITRTALDLDWAVCAFGQGETDCLQHALASGGKVRIGFENNLLHADGRVARDNADRVNEFMKA